jgi:hypothetical protein
MITPAMMNSKETICLSTRVTTMAMSIPMAPVRLPRTAVRG